MKTIINQHGMQVSAKIREDLTPEDVVASWVAVGASAKLRQVRVKEKQITGRSMRRLSLAVGVDKNG